LALSGLRLSEQAAAGRVRRPAEEAVGMDARSRLLTWFGGTPVGGWTIKHLVSPLDRWLYRRTGGRLVPPGHPHGPIVLLTTIGRRTGNQHTTPVFHLQDGERIILGNVTPHGQRANPC